MAGSAFDDLVARVERELGIADAARRACEGMASTVASLDWIEKIQRAINPTQLLYDQLIKPYELAAYNITDWYAKSFDYARAPMADIFSELQRYNEFIRSITEQFSDDIFIELESHLIDEGWYLSIDLPASVVLDLADLHDEQKCEEIEQWLRRFYRQKVDYVEPAVLSAFPHRRRILGAAFAAHRRQEYALSIPVFLSQADGISAELWQENFFRPRRSNRRIDQILEVRDSGLSATVLRHLYDHGSLRASFKPGSKPNGLNRHAVIHGTSTDYDTEENSLRCIALLGFLISLQPLFDRDNSGASLN